MSEFNFDQYIKIASEIKLGELTTESFHPITTNLSDEAKNNLSNGISSIKQVDQLALEKLKGFAQEAYKLYQDCQNTFKTGGRVFLAGCGATGRLSLAVEAFARQLGKDDVIGFMAGGDFALIKSVESFEDRMSYGSRQLTELGFNKNDLLLAITEGGETSFVIGAAMEAARLSEHKPYFIYCNPDEQLIHLERCRKVIENDSINKLNLTVGPMALSGSTRMQATTVQMLVAGAAILFNCESFEEFKKEYLSLIDELQKLDYNLIEEYIEKEASIYLDEGFVTYKSDSDLAISILTDTTERSPTFNLKPFETLNDNDSSLCYLTVAKTTCARHAWRSMLGRDPIGLDWGNLETQVNLDAIYLYDISENSIKRRESLKNHHIFTIAKGQHSLEFRLHDLTQSIPVNTNSTLSYQLSLKLLLNTMSTLIMGKLNRYESNMMTWVKPSNYKLIDRATRYVLKLLSNEGIDKKYDEVSRAVIELSKESNAEFPIVLKVFQHLKNELKK